MNVSVTDTIEDIILADDRRGIAALRPFLPTAFCDGAARLIALHAGTVFIATGFFTEIGGFPETDGPPGALAVGRALGSLGYRIYYVTDRLSAPLLISLTGDEEAVIAFPIADERSSEKYAEELLLRFSPSVLIAVERCGRTDEGSYLNIRGRDISSCNAKIDYLFTRHERTIGVGDGGNEIGMGNLAHAIPGVAGLPQKPCAIRTTCLLMATVSNWGAYGLVAALSRLNRRDLLPRQEDEEALIERMVDAGAVDGISGERTCTIDGFSLAENSRILARLRLLLR